VIPVTAPLRALWFSAATLLDGTRRHFALNTERPTPMPTLTIQGHDVFYREAGTGPAVILLHSSSSSSGQWRALIERLATRFHVIAPDLFGYGKTGVGPQDAQELAAAETELVQALAARVPGPVHLIGHSMGGAVAARAALKLGPKLATLSVFEPVLFNLLGETGQSAALSEIRGVAQALTDHVIAGNSRAAAHGFIDYWSGEGAFDMLPDPVKDAVGASMAKVALEFRAGFHHSQAPLGAFAAIDAPVLIMKGAKTTRAAARVIDVLRPVLPNHAYLEFPGVPHMGPVTHSDLADATIDAFLTHYSQGAADERMAA
jgi:pimeloyl-ACP methyl ester carboxylesterase